MFDKVLGLVAKSIISLLGIWLHFKEHIMLNIVAFGVSFYRYPLRVIIKKNIYFDQKHVFGIQAIKDVSVILNTMHLMQISLKHKFTNLPIFWASLITSYNLGPHAWR